MTTVTASMMMVTLLTNNLATKGHPTSMGGGSARQMMSGADRPLAAEIITGADMAATETRDNMVAIITRIAIETMMTTIMKEGLPGEWRPEVQQEEEEMVVVVEMRATEMEMILIIIIEAETQIIIHVAVLIGRAGITNQGVT